MTDPDLLHIDRRTLMETLTEAMAVVINSQDAGENKGVEESMNRFIGRSGWGGDFGIPDSIFRAKVSAAVAMTMQAIEDKKSPDRSQGIGE